MKTKLTLLTICLIFITSFSFAQKKNEAQSIIKNKVNIKKYHTHEELDNMQKGELITLYMERIQVLSGTIPYIAFATKPGVTMSSLGIPNSGENRKTLENQEENTGGLGTFSEENMFDSESFINSKEEEFSKLSDDDLRAKTLYFKKLIQDECKEEKKRGTFTYGKVCKTTAGQLQCRKIYHIALYEEWISKCKLSLEV